MSVFGRVGHRVDRKRFRGQDDGIVERRSGKPIDFQCVVLSGGISKEPTHAVAGSLTWHKDRKEKLGDFIERAKQAARARGERSVIIRGLKW